MLARPLESAYTRAVSGLSGGAIGASPGAIVCDGNDGALAPAPLLADTVNVYSVPFFKPVTFT